MSWRVPSVFTAVLVSLVLSASASAQQFSSGTATAIAERFKDLSEVEQKALARQYGVEIPVAPSPPVESELARPGSPVSPPPVLLQAQKDEVNEARNIEEKSPRYGRTLFDRAVSTFAPTDNSPVPSSYRLGVGDEITVQLFGKENKQLSLQIGRSGDINFPKLGSITLSGLTFESARDLIQQRISKQLIGVDAVISMGRLRAINIFMAGEVAVPGTYSVSALTTLTQALFQAGGVTNIGTLRNIQVRRAGSVIATLDTYDILMEGDVSSDIRLQSGDVVFVPTYLGLVTLEGEVKRPLTYELAGGETLGDLIDMAGGFTRDAFIAQATLSRYSEKTGRPSVKSINLLDMAVLDELATNGDQLRVSRRGSQPENSIRLTGAVSRPGVYGWKPGLRFSDVVEDPRRDLSLEADPSVGLIISLKNASQFDVEVRQFSVRAAIENPDSEKDPELAEYDEILIFSVPEGVAPDAPELTGRQALLAPLITILAGQGSSADPARLVSISGAVRAPGRYPLVAAATIHDLINLAGGLQASAHIESAELRRLEVSAGQETSIDYIDVDLSTNSDGLALKLDRSDHITVRAKSDWSPVNSMVVEGAVRFPGSYLIRDNETLSNVIERAGGITEQGSVNGAIFTRKVVAEAQALRTRELVDEIKSVYAARLLTQEDGARSLEDIRDVLQVLNDTTTDGRLSINLEDALRGDPEADITVEDGDRLFVPVTQNTIVVTGEVKVSQTHTYYEHLNVNDYITLSAGLTKRADEKEIYILKANGTVQYYKNSLWRFQPDAVLEPGDTIVVPINIEYRSSLTSWREITQVLYQSIVSLAAVSRL